jgi:urease accessory protein
LAVQRPFYPEGDLCHLYLLHPPGGLVGGDRLDIGVEVGPGASALVTTPGATKCYRSAGPRSLQRQCLRLGEGAALEWLPQETILFRGASCALETRVELGQGARFLGWELYCLGRPASGERFDAGRADLALSIHRGGRPLLMDRLLVQGQASLDGPAGLRGRAAVGTMIATPADPGLLALVRGLLPAQQGAEVLAAATLVDGLLAVRLLGPTTQGVRALLDALWRGVREPLLGRPPCPPRIWAT